MVCSRSNNVDVSGLSVLPAADAGEPIMGTIMRIGGTPLR
jgi:hypothetical protein